MLFEIKLYQPITLFKSVLLSCCTFHCRIVATLLHQKLHSSSHPSSTSNSSLHHHHRQCPDSISPILIPASPAPLNIMTARSNRQRLCSFSSSSCTSLNIYTQSEVSLQMEITSAYSCVNFSTVSISNMIL